MLLTRNIEHMSKFLCLADGFRQDLEALEPATPSLPRLGRHAATYIDHRGLVEIRPVSLVLIGTLNRWLSFLPIWVYLF